LSENSAQESFSAATSGKRSHLWLSSGADGTSSCRDLAKTDETELNILIKDIQTDSRRVRLLQILSGQLELLINKGKPNLCSLLTSLKEESLLSEEDYKELRAHYALETVGTHTPAMEINELTCATIVGYDTLQLFKQCS
jgi:hypothetical protein